MTLHHTDRLHIYPGHGGLHFIIVPNSILTEKLERGGWGSVKISATIGVTTWETSMFYTREHDGYFLFIKKSVRITEHLIPGEMLEIVIKVV